MSNKIEQKIPSLIALQADFENSLPPVNDWNPPLNGDLDMRIDGEGDWYYLGDKIRRQPLVKLFSSILKQENGDYFLVTPVEKWRIRVDVAPLFVHSVRWVDQTILFTTNVGNDILLGKEHPLTVETDEKGNPIPIILAQRELPALLSRSVFYTLVESAEIRSVSSGRESVEPKTVAIIKSGSEEFCLGDI